MASKLVDDATSEMLMLPNWDKNVEISDLVNADPESAREVVKHIKKRLGIKNPKVVQLTLTLYDMCVKNSTPSFYPVAGAKDVVAVLSSLAEGQQGGTDKETADAAAALLQEFAHAFAAYTATVYFKPAYDALLAKGTVRFPPLDKSTVFTVPPPPAPGSASASASAARSPALGASSSSPYLGGSAGGGGRPPAYPSPPPGISLGASGGGAAAAAAAPRSRGSSLGLPGAKPGAAASQGRGSDGSSLESQLAFVDSAFEKLRADLRAVRSTVASAAKALVAGTHLTTSTTTTTTTTSSLTDAFLDDIDMLEQVPPRLANLIEAGVSGVLDEELFEACLAANDAVGRILDVALPLLGEGKTGVINPSSGDMKTIFPELQDLAESGAGSKAGEAAAAAAATAPSSAPPASEPGGSSSSSTSGDLLGLFSAAAGGTGSAGGPAAAAVGTTQDLFAGGSSSGGASRTSFAPVASAEATAGGGGGWDDFQPSASSLSGFDLGAPPGSALPAPAPAPAPAAAGGAAVLADLDALLK